MKTTLLAALVLVLISCEKTPSKGAPVPVERVNPTTPGGTAGPSPLGPARGGAAPLVTFNESHLSEYTEGLAAEGTLAALIETDYGTLDCELFEDKAPQTVANFVGLARGLRDFSDHESGERTRRPYFDGIECHRLIPGFMIQCGDPTATGTGGPGYRFADEFHPEARHDQAGTRSMANAGPATNGSQFFITDGPTPSLDQRHSVFGRCAPASIVRTIANVPKAMGESSRPARPVRLNKVTIVRR